MSIDHKKLIQDIINNYNINITISEIEEKYNEDHRYYHNIDHINFLNNKILELYNKKEIDKIERDILIISSIFHDIIYNVEKKDNEKKSVEFFKNKIENNTDEYVVENVKRIILDTIDHKPKNYLSKIFSDLDMYTISNVSFNELLNIERKIRSEFIKYDFNTFKKGRMEFLNKILNTEYGEKNKKNIKKLINYIENFDKNEKYYAIKENNLKYLKYFNNDKPNISDFLLFL